jgi:prepilin-type N-terminal cleavage/methylation domain-containing protein
MFRRLGLTLLEMTIAIALFATLLVGVLDATISLNGFPNSTKS